MQRNPLVLCILLLVACSGFQPLTMDGSGPASSPDPGGQKPGIPFAASNATPTAASTATPASPHIPPSLPVPALPSYTLQVSLDYIAHRIVVDEAIIYPNNTGQTLTELVLAVEPNLWAGCFDLESLVMGAQDVSVMLTSDRLEVHLSNPLVPDQTAYLSLRYSLDLPPADRHHVFGYNNLQANLVDWYPFIVPYAGGWLLHPPAAVGEHLAYDTADFDVTVSLANGALPLTIGASAPAAQVGGTWHYAMTNSRTFVFSASDGYQTATATTDGVTITSYFFASERTPGRAVLGEVSKAVSTFHTLFGPLPHADLSIVESPFYDGLEFEGLFFLSRDFYREDDGTVLNNLVDIAVHETAHQWWFGLVGNDQALEPWLDEAMATYSERLFYERNYPDVTAWWTFRVNAYSPSGWVDTDIYHAGDFRTYANAVYLRGAQFLEALRRRVGDEAFFAFLKDYASQMAGRRATADDFFRILRQHTGADISSLQQSFFQRYH